MESPSLPNHSSSRSISPPRPNTPSSVRPNHQQPPCCTRVRSHFVQPIPSHPWSLVACSVLSSLILTSLLHIIDVEPTCTSQALSDPRWCNFMSEEFTALMRHRNWDLVPPLHNVNIICCKWVFASNASPMVQLIAIKLVLQGLSSATWCRLC